MPNVGPVWRQSRSSRYPLPLPGGGEAGRQAGLHDCYRPGLDFVRHKEGPAAGVRSPTGPSGTILAVVAALLLMLSLAGGLVIFTGLFAPGSRLDAAAEQRERQLHGIKSTIGELDAKLGAFSDKLQHVGEMAIDNIEESQGGDERLNRLETEVQQLRQRASSVDPEQAVQPCGPQAPAAPSGSSHQETGDDQRG